MRFRQGSKSAPPRFVRCFVVLLLLFVLACGGPSRAPKRSQATKPANPALAQPLDRRPPRYPGPAQTAGGEGVVLVSFVVDTEGRTRDIVVLDSVGDRAFEAAAVSAVADWRYRPAMRNGRAVEVADNRVLLPFRLVSTQSKKGAIGAKPEFIKRYRKLHRLVSSGEFNEALAQMAPMMRSSSLNLYENARLNLLRAFIFETQKEDVQLYRALSEMTLLRGDVIEEEHYRNGLAKKVRLALVLDRYGSAAREIKTLARATGGKLEPEMQALADEVERIRLDPNPFTVVAAIGSGSRDRVRDEGSGEASPTAPAAPQRPARWTYLPLRSRVSLTAPIEGRLDRYSVRCPNAVEDGDVITGQILELEAGYGACTLIVFGLKGTTFGLVEEPEPRGQMPGEDAALLP